MNEKQMLLGVSLAGSPERAMLWQIAALALRPSKSHSGLALLYGPELLPGRCGAFAPEGWNAAEAAGSGACG